METYRNKLEQSIETDEDLAPLILKHRRPLRISTSWSDRSLVLFVDIGDVCVNQTLSNPAQHLQLFRRLLNRCTTVGAVDGAADIQVSVIFPEVGITPPPPPKIAPWTNRGFKISSPLPMSILRSTFSASKTVSS